MNIWLAIFDGFSSLFDLSGESYRSRPKIQIPETDEEAFKLDEEALRSDWEKIIGPDKRV